MRALRLSLEGKNNFIVTISKPILYNSNTNNRRLIWQANHKYIEQHNEEAKLGVHSFTLRMNKFGDFTNLEFEKLFMGFNATKNMIKVDGPKYQKPLGFQVPDSVDWRYNWTQC